MSTIPSLALIPSGVKASKVYSVLPTDGSGDFTFTRSGNATRVNSDGLIELVTSNVPRLNYPLIDGVVSGCPSLLLEPQRINLIQYSEDFSQGYWSKSRATILSNQTISPDGTLTADLLTITDTPENYAQTNVSVTVSGAIQTVSCFVKKGTNDFAHILLWDTASNGSRQWFDVNNGTVGSSAIFGSGISVNSASIENYGNGWFRCIVVFNCSLTSVRTRISASNGDGQTNGTIGKTIFIWGYQLESNSSYATSYIPNYGTALGVTRSAETCNNAGDVNTFNDSEGVLFANIASLSDTVSTYNSIGLGVNSANERIALGFQAPSNIYIFKRTTSSWITAKSSNIKLYNKVAISYNTNDNHFWLNGFKIASDTTIGDLVQPIELGFEASYGGEQFYGNTKQIQYFDTALNDSDLETLTSWDSFSDMATSQLYSVE
jgi:hypothetical protein